MYVQITEQAEERKFYFNQTFAPLLSKQEIISSWNYNNSFHSKDIRLASLYCGETDVSKVCPEHLKASWESSREYIKSHVRAALSAKMNLNDHTFFDIIPQHVLSKHLEIKNRICEYVFSNYSRPENYDYLLELTRSLDQIRRYGLKIDTSGFKARSVKDRNFAQRLSSVAHCCDYNIFGTRTGRLSTRPGTFPILNLNKEYRSLIRPKLDCVVELDYNAAELRTLLALAGKEQPRVDIHQAAVTTVFEDKISRDEVKTETFKWLYGGKSEYDEQLNKMYDKETILKKHFFGDHIVTPFGKKIQSDEHHALSYIIQSTLGEIVLKKLIEVGQYLQQFKSNIYFTVHDSIVLDFAEDEKNILWDLYNIFSNTPIGRFPVSISAGTNYGKMKEVKWRL